MRRLSSVCLSVLAAMVLLSCQKEIDFTNPSQNNNNNGNNNNNTANSYFPLTTGTWWKYKDSTTGNISTGTISNVKRTFNNIVYNAMVSAAGTQNDTSWAASPQPNYYITAKGVAPGGASFDILFHYLNDTASVGYNWQYNSGSGNGFASYIKTTIVEKGISMTVAGKSYTNVTHTRLELSYDIFGTLFDFAVYDYFISKGVGIIKIRSDLGMIGFPMPYCTDLIDYSVK